MACYFFDLHAELIDIDSEGIDCEDDAAALRFAFEQASEMAQDSEAEGRFDPAHHVICRAQDGRTLGMVTFGQTKTALP